MAFKITQPDKNRSQVTDLNFHNNQAGQDCPLKLYISCLEASVTEETIRSIFDPFGKVSYSIINLLSFCLVYFYVFLNLYQIDSILIAKDEFQRSKGYGHIQFLNAEDAKRAMEQLNNSEIENRPIKISLSPEKTSDNVSNFSDFQKPHSNISVDNNLDMMDTVQDGFNLDLSAENKTISSQDLKENSNPVETPSDVGVSECILLTNMFDLIE